MTDESRGMRAVAAGSMGGVGLLIIFLSQIPLLVLVDSMGLFDIFQKQEPTQDQTKVLIISILIVVVIAGVFPLRGTGIRWSLALTLSIVVAPLALLATWYGPPNPSLYDVFLIWAGAWISLSGPVSMVLGFGYERYFRGDSIWWIPPAIVGILLAWLAIVTVFAGSTAMVLIAVLIWFILPAWLSDASYRAANADDLSAFGE